MLGDKTDEKRREKMEMLGDKTDEKHVPSSPYHRADDHTVEDGPPSPVSVLEQFFVEESVNSPSTVSLAAEPPVEPFCIDIKEHNATSLLESQLDLKSTAVWLEKSYTDRRLLFGYISEVILEIYQCYFGCSPWISLLYPRLQPAMLSKNLVHEVLRHVDWQLLLELPQQTSQQLVEKDWQKFGIWMDNRLDMEEVFTELIDSILEDLVIDAAIQLQT
ncbi:hypothetical protein PVK06_013732 [Gossypium arboreum]|uniref:DUF4378 domain-containing protein n=1 Tax=Gossypium arboreum TaxID=29729 RepID=A0ABR0PT55_GOSAR|nr:hypothetical protein PVK06_013732 [Gossypium arboreum]